ncbi:RNase H domain-containing protein [Trichonephila clavata]|uniref:RNase H domain-containing protein n=1 Tax=Trichonephila clavata TaxID=2740835 RepID=A0A8X6IZL7_TRICU|nr:RNase H domain-containing protein [Trichonephila clavata]
MKTNTEEIQYRFKNPDNSSVFRSELVAIREALNLALDNRASDTWILTDSKSSIQFLKDWSNVLDMLGQDILFKSAALTKAKKILPNRQECKLILIPPVMRDEVLPRAGYSSRPLDPNKHLFKQPSRWVDKLCPS